MGTTSTDERWFWYIRQKESTGYIGIIDDDGDAPATADLNIDIWGYEVPAEVTTDGSVLPVPAELELGFLKGCVDELLQMHGSDNIRFARAYDEAVDAANSKRIRESEQPLIIQPLDMRDD